MTLSPALASALEAARPRFNAQVKAAQRARSGFDLDALAEAIRVRLDPLAIAVDAVAPDRVASVVEAAFAQTVTLVAQPLSGERRAIVDRVWSETAMALAPVVAERPGPVLAMLTNAALTIAVMPGARAGEWITRMAGLAPLVTADTLAAAGQIAAWRSGMAHYRDGALAVADTLPAALALAAIGAEGEWPAVRQALAENRWWRPDGVDASIRFGGFAGFGGPFEAPPEVRGTEGGFLVRAGERVHLLVADAFGATLHPASTDVFADAAPARPTRTLPSSLPSDDLQSAVSGDTLALASPFSHYLEVRSWRP